MNSNLLEVKEKHTEMKAEADKVSEILNGKSQNTDEEKTTTSTRLVQLMEGEKTTLFHAPDGKAFAIIEVNGCREIFLLSGKKFKNYLMGAYWNLHKKPANAQAVPDAMGVLQAKAQFEGEEHSVFTRIAWQGEKVSLYLADRSCRVVEIGPTAWHVRDDSNVYFVKSKNLAPMPEPETGGDIEALRAFINIKKEDDDTWRLMVAWLVAAFLEGPSPYWPLWGNLDAQKPHSPAY